MYTWHPNTNITTSEINPSTYVSTPRRTVLKGHISRSRRSRSSPCLTRACLLATGGGAFTGSSSYPLRQHLYRWKASGACWWFMLPIASRLAACSQVPAICGPYVCAIWMCFVPPAKVPQRPSFLPLALLCLNTQSVGSSERPLFTVVPHFFLTHWSSRPCRHLCWLTFIFKSRVLWCHCWGVSGEKQANRTDMSYSCYSSSFVVTFRAIVWSNFSSLSALCISSLSCCGWQTT